jgi:hypothetical protein
MAKTAAHSTASVTSAQSPTRPSPQNETASASGAGAPSGAVLSPGTVSHRAGPYVYTGSLRWLRKNLRVSQPQTHPRRCCCLVPTSHQVCAGQSWCRRDCSPMVAPGEVVGQSCCRCAPLSRRCEQVSPRADVSSEAADQSQADVCHLILQIYVRPST